MKKKISFIVLFLLMLFVSGCSQDNILKDDLITNNSWISMLSNKTQKYNYNWKMEKPDTQEIWNIESMQNWFSETWNKKVWPEILEWKEYLSNCKEISIVTEDGDFDKKFSIDQIKKGNISVSGKYYGQWLNVKLNSEQKNYLDTHGWIVFDPGENWHQWSSEMGILEQEERGLYYGKIWWQKIEYNRYPYNTVFVTTDMLLHFYHKIFANSLRYYEESIARNTMQKLSENMFDKFTKLYKENQNNELSSYYAFSVAYWSIPYSIFIPQWDIEIAINNAQWSNESDTWWDMWNDLAKEDVEKLIIARLDSINNKIPTEYQDAVKSTMTSILQATSNRAEDKMLAVFGTNVDSPMNIQQDYTQFTPRGHYTDSSLLRTYFLGMKWFMREKLYFNDIEQTKASLVMINNIKNDELSSFNELYDSIQNLIWQDDDVNVSDIQKYLSQKWWNLDKDIISSLTKDDQEKLKTLRPQKIISTHYETASVWAVTESQAKDETAWFVFFGEKFTIDSFVFDKMTAGSSEKENIYKPSLQTTFIAPEVLINTWIIRDVVDLWMERAKTKDSITQAQIDGYDKSKSEITSELEKFDFAISTYHRWIDSLSWLFALTDNNLPYFMQDKLYKYKELNTFQWSYSELKHDTILYVKQAYAEMGMWGEGECQILVDPPQLPVPKWYVEPNIDLIDSLLKLTNDTKEFFKDDDSYLEFAKFLIFVRDISIKQSQNEIIDDGTFEKLRLYYDDLINILYPKKVIDGDNDFISALIADIFTSENNGPLYIATWRPYLMITMIKDINWARAVIWPVYSTYEFYDTDEPISRSQWRYTDDDRQKWYDELDHNSIYTIPMEKLLEYK